MVRKKFDQDLYQENDQRGRNAVNGLLTRAGWDVEDREHMGADLLARKKGAMIHHEVEVKVCWEGPWPRTWETVHIPERKGHLARTHANIWFWVLRSDCLEALAVHGSVILSSPVQVVRNRLVPDGELFFMVHRAYARHYILAVKP